MAAEEEGSGGGGGCSGGDRKGSPAPTKSGGGGAAKFLAGMPSRGNFSSGSVSSSLVRNPHAEITKLFLSSGVLRRLDSRGEAGF